MNTARGRDTAGERESGTDGEVAVLLAIVADFLVGDGRGLGGFLRRVLGGDAGPLRLGGNVRGEVRHGGEVDDGQYMSKIENVAPFPRESASQPLTTAVRGLPTLPNKNNGET